MKLSNKYNLYILLNLAQISESGYFKYKNKILNNQTKEDKEKQDYELIRDIALRFNRKYWDRRISMEIDKLSIIMNDKKILRIMHKYWLLAKIRRKNPYRNIQKATIEHKSMKNILNRKFRWIIPLKKLWTDITYIKFQWRWTYLSIIKDMVTGEVLASKISGNLWISFVQNTVKELENKYSNNLKWVILHSDQWFHYTHPEYSKKLKELWLIQSMSRKWNCIDNAPIESFFGHLKDEIDVSWCNSFNELEKYIENYIFYYNNDRPQWNKKKMTPVNYRNYLMSLN